MPKKANDEKMTGQLLLMLPETLLKDLKAAAKASGGATVQELLRRAGDAIVRHHKDHGEVPMDMELLQRAVGERSRLRKAGLSLVLGQGPQSLSDAAAADARQREAEILAKDLGAEVHKKTKTRGKQTKAPRE